MSVCMCSCSRCVCVFCVMCLVQMETEPVVASEPVFSAGPSAQVACHVPAIPNGSSTLAKTEERSGKLTAEQLAAIEDEELLDKMVLHTQVIILDDLVLKAPLCNKYSSFSHAECFTKSRQLCEGIFGKVTAKCCVCVYAQCYVGAACINRAMPLWLFVRNDLIVSVLSAARWVKRLWGEEDDPCSHERPSQEKER